MEACFVDEEEDEKAACSENVPSSNARELSDELPKMYSLRAKIVVPFDFGAPH